MSRRGKVTLASPAVASEVIAIGAKNQAGIPGGWDGIAGRGKVERGVGNAKRGAEARGLIGLQRIAKEFYTF
jgi:hypothetical protein